MEHRNSGPRGPPSECFETDLGRMLKKARGERPISAIRDNSRRETLRAYEDGKLLPPRTAINWLAACYDVSSKSLSAAYRSSVAQLANGPISFDTFLDTLKSATNGDRLVFVAQHSMISDEIEAFADPINHVLREGGYVATVAYLPIHRLTRSDEPSRATDASSDRWHTNYLQVARALDENLYLSDQSLKDKIDYLFIGSPSMRDFAFLSPRGANIYLGRHEGESAPNALSSHAWHENGISSSDKWFTKYDAPNRAEFHDWLSKDCGLSFSGAGFQASSRTNQRDVRYATLSKILSPQYE